MQVIKTSLAHNVLGKHIICLCCSIAGLLVAGKGLATKSKCILFGDHLKSEACFIVVFLRGKLLKL